MKSLVKEFECYSGGVMQSQADSHADHAVSVLGWGEESGLKYWVVRHSGGTQWGEEGFFRIQRGAQPGTGQNSSGQSAAGTLGIEADCWWATLRPAVVPDQSVCTD